MGLRDDLAATSDRRERARLKGLAFSTVALTGQTFRHGQLTLHVIDGVRDEGLTANDSAVVSVRVRLERNGRDWTPDHLNPIRIVNPPTLVPDPAGPIDLGRRGRYREDMAAAVMQTLRDLPEREVWARAADRTGLGPAAEGTTTTVYSDTADGLNQNSSTVYLTARSGGGTFQVRTTNTQEEGGQTFATPNYIFQELMFGWDTSAIDDADTVSAAVVDLWLLTDLSTTDHTQELRLHDWGATLTSADFVAGADLGSKTLLASIATSGIGATGAYKTFTDVAMPANVNKTGFTRVVLCTDRMRNADVPTGNERMDWSMADTSGTTNDPKLTVTHAAAAAATNPGWYSARGGWW